MKSRMWLCVDQSAVLSTMALVSMVAGSRRGGCLLLAAAAVAAEGAAEAAFLPSAGLLTVIFTSHCSCCDTCTLLGLGQQV